MTNPDTNTLNGALEQLGITMADNLVTMGVSDADPSDGLTTLASKILQISPVPPTPTPASIDLVATNSILSYADGDTTVLTATVLDSNDDPVENATVELYKAGTLWDTLTTDSSGECSKTYTSAGVGDVSFEAKCNLLTKTYAVEDCYFYNSLTSDNSLFTLVQGTASLEYSNTGLKYTGTATTDCIHQLNAELPNGEYTVECDVTALPSSGYSTGIGTEDAQILKGNTGLYARYISKSGDFFNNKSYTIPFHLKIEVTGSTSKTIKYYKDDVLMGTGSNVTQNKQLRLRSYSGRYIKIKDLKIKPLMV